LSLYDSTVQVDLDRHLCHPRLNAFVDANSNLFLLKVRDVSALGGFYNNIYFSRPEDIELDAPELKIEKNRLVLKMELPEAGFYVTAMQIVPRPSHAFRREMKKMLRPQYQAPELG